MHITLRTVAEVRNLRTRVLARKLQRAMRRWCAPNFRVVHYTILNNHIHMIVEADDRKALPKGLQRLNGGMARIINKHHGRRGTLWRDRYHEQVLSSPAQVRNAIAYVLNNARRHMRGTRVRAVRGWVDDRSTAIWFPHWKSVAPGSLFDVDDRELRPPAPRTWLLRTGWKKAGPSLDLERVPGPSG